MLDFRMTTFLTLAREGSYTRAAEALCVTQPTVTQHIQRLEQDYGTKLVRLDGKRLTLTEAGIFLRSKLETIATDGEKISRAMAEFSGKENPLRIGATMTVGEFALGEVLASLVERNIPFHLFMENTGHLLAELREGKIDCAFVEGYFDKSKVDFRVFRREDFIGVAAPDFPAEGTLTLSELTEFPLLLREEGSGTREVLERNLSEQGYRPEMFRKNIVVQNLNVILDLVSRGLGISFVYRAAAERRLLEGTLRELRIKHFSVAHEFCLVMPKESLFRDKIITQLQL